MTDFKVEKYWSGIYLPNINVKVLLWAIPRDQSHNNGEIIEPIREIFDQFSQKLPFSRFMQRMGNIFESSSLFLILASSCIGHKLRTYSIEIVTVWHLQIEIKSRNIVFESISSMGSDFDRQSIEFLIWRCGIIETGIFVLG